MNLPSWTASQAKARFGEILDRALNEGPQAITRNGREVAVVVAIDEWRRKLKRSDNLAQFFAKSPLRRSGLKVRRMRERAENRALSHALANSSR